MDNILVMKGSLLKKELIEAQNRRKSSFYQWSAEELQTQRQQAIANANEKTKVFLSFYTPTQRHNDLNNKKSLWNVYLEVNGVRYTGNIIKNSHPVAKTQKLYPYHNRWSNAYEMEFPVSTQEVEQSQVRLIVTGSLGQGTLTF